MTAANDAFVMPLAVMLRSLATSIARPYHVDVRVLTTRLSTQNWQRLLTVCNGFSLSLREVIIDPSALQGLKVDGHVSNETYFRLLAPEYVDDVDTALYLDADLIVRHSIHELFQHPFDGAHLLAVPNSSQRSGVFAGERGVPSFAVLGIPGNTRTFNAGVMLLDLRRLREAQSMLAILRYLHEYRHHVLWWDQDGLNAILYRNWHPLPAKWNVMTSHLSEFSRGYESMLDPETLEAIAQDPGIIHFSSPSKPWLSGYDGPYLEHWQTLLNAVYDRLRPRDAEKASHVGNS